MFPFLKKYSVALTIAWAIFIFILCATPGQYLPSVSWLELLSFDKFVHAFIFFVLGTFVFFSVQQKNKSNNFYLMLLCLCVAYGISLEIMQATVFINRSFDYFDMLANTVGCGVSFLLRRKIYAIP